MGGGHAASTDSNRLPRWVVLWLVVSNVACLLDASYCLLRPHSSPGGRLHYPLFVPYQLYERLDRLYTLEAKASGDGLCEAQSWLNLAEIAAGWTAVVLSARGDARCIPLALVTSTATAWKTVLYQLVEVCAGFPFTGQNGLLGSVVLGVMLNTWVVVPLAVVWTLWGRVMRALKAGEGGRKLD